jgi:hypothetical protein
LDIVVKHGDRGKNMPQSRTVVGIEGEDFILNGAPTYPGRSFEGQRIEGLLFNVRAVQAIFDDANPATRPHWAYPDTGVWDPERNVREFCEALPTWREHGVLGFTVNFQCGGPAYQPDVYDHYNASGFSRRGYLLPAFADRLGRVLAAADELGMVVIVGLFYGKHLQKMASEEAVWLAAHAALNFLKVTGRRNVLVELANELDVAWQMAGYDFISPRGAHVMLYRLRSAFPQFLYGASLGGIDARNGDGVPSAELIEASDFVLIHGNGTTPSALQAGIRATRAVSTFRQRPKPLVINEDSTGIPNLDVAWQNRASWGYYDQGYGSGWSHDRYLDYSQQPREDRIEDLSGFQTPPVNWTLNTPEKRAFFARVKEITGV